jgi:hypothetical protein
VAFFAVNQFIGHLLSTEASAIDGSTARASDASRDLLGEMAVLSSAIAVLASRSTRALSKN